MPIQSRLGKKMELEIQRLGINGEGVAQWYGYTIFVDGALPGETVRASLYEKRKSYGRAFVIEVLIASPARQKPVCPLFGKCGGCQLMHLEYSHQLIAKRQRVIDAMERIGKLQGVEVNPCIASPQPFHYRNKIQLPVAAGVQGPRLGLYARNSHELIDMEECHIHCALGQQVYERVQKLVKSSEAAAECELKHVLIKTAVHTKQVLVVLITAGEASHRLRSLAKEIIGAMPEIRGVVQNINPAEDNTVLGDRFVLLEGEERIEEELLGVRFKVSAASFFQVNPPLAERLYQTVIDAAALTGQERVLDVYCGVGTLSLLLSRYAAQVRGIECVPEAVKDAASNAALNGISNAQFICTTAEEMVCDQSFDLVVLNPPRKGCERSVIEKIVALQPAKIIYVSCDPATLARDLALFSEQGWRIELVQPFDMFPQTAHVETVVCLKK